MVPRSCYIIILFFIISSNCNKSNMTNGFDIRDDHHRITKYVAIVLLTVFLFYGIVSNLLMAITFCDRGNIYSRAFILISLQLIISNFICYFPDIVIVLPEILQTKSTSEVHQMTLVTHVVSLLKSLAIISALHFTFLLTLNRFVTLILPKYNALFESVRLYFLLGFAWLLVFAITTADFYYCTTRYYIADMQWKKNCTKQSREMGNTFLKLRYGWMTLLPVAMFVMYIVIFYSIQRKRRSPLVINQKKEVYGRRANTLYTRSYERDMLIQAVLICGSLESVILIFNFLPPFVLKIFGQKAVIPSGIFVNCYDIFSHFLPPTVYFIYIKQARNFVKNLFQRFRMNIATEGTAIVTPNNIPKA